MRLNRGCSGSSSQQDNLSHNLAASPHWKLSTHRAPRVAGLRCSHQLPANRSNVRSRSSEQSTAQPPGANSTLSTRDPSARGGIEFRTSQATDQTSFNTHAPRSTSHFESESRATTTQNGQQSHLLDRLRYDSPPIPCPSIEGPKTLIMLSRHRRPLLAAGHRDAALLQPQVTLGIPRLRRRGRELRVLAAGRGRAADQDAAGTEASYPGEAGAEDGARGECCGRADRVRYQRGCDKMDGMRERRDCGSPGTGSEHTRQPAEGELEDSVYKI